MADNIRPPEEGLLLCVDIVLSDKNGCAQELNGKDNASRRGNPQQGDTGAKNGPVVRKFHVGRQNGALDGGDQSKDKKEVAHVAVGGGGGSTAGRSHKIEEVCGARKDRNGSANDVKVNLPGGIVFRKGLVQVFLVDISRVGILILVVVGGGGVVRFFVDWFECIEYRVVEAKFFGLFLSLYLPQERNFYVGQVLRGQTCRIRHANRRGTIPYLEIPSITGSFVFVILVHSLEMPCIVHRNSEKEPDWERPVGGKEHCVVFGEKCNGFVFIRLMKNDTESCESGGTMGFQSFNQWESRLRQYSEWLRDFKLTNSNDNSLRLGSLYATCTNLKIRKHSL